MNERAFAEIYGVLADDITQVEFNESLFGLIRVEIEDSDKYFKTNFIHVYLYGDELLAKFIPLLKKGVRISLIGELESLQTKIPEVDAYQTDSIENDLCPVIKIADKRRIIIIQNEPNSNRLERKINKTKLQNIPQTSMFRCSSNMSL